MILKKRIFNWLSKFKPGVRFRFDYSEDNNIYEVLRNPEYFDALEDFRVLTSFDEERSMAEIVVSNNIGLRKNIIFL